MPFGTLSQADFPGQRFGDSIDLLFGFGLRGLQLLNLGFQPGFLRFGTLLLDLQFFDAGFEPGEF